MLRAGRLVGRVRAQHVEILAAAGLVEYLGHVAPASH